MGNYTVLKGDLVPMWAQNMARKKKVVGIKHPLQLFPDK